MLRITAFTCFALFAGTLSWHLTRTSERIEVRANTHTPSLQDGASLAFASDGTLHVIWQSRRQQQGATGVYAQRFAAGGARIGAETAVGNGTLAQRREPALAITRGGEAWYGFERFANDEDCVVCRADGKEITVHGPSTGHQYGLALASCGDGFVAAWLDEGRAFVRRFTANGCPREEASVLECRAQRVRLADDGQGGFVAAWGVLDAKGKPSGIRARRFDAEGRAGSAFDVNTANPLGSLEPSVACAAEGIVIAWLDNARDPERYDVVARRFTLAGTACGAAFVVSPADACFQSGVSVACGDEGFTVAFARGEDVRVRRFSQAGSPLGESVVLREGAQTSGASPLALGANGGFACAWSGACEGDGDAAGVSYTLPRGIVAVREPAPAMPATPAISTDSSCTLVHEATPHDPPTYAPVKGSPPAGGAYPMGLADYGFQGLTTTGWTPPDPHIAVGPNHVVVIANGAIAFFQKNGTKDFQQAIGNTQGFWGTLGANNFVFDPEVVFDPHSQRFIAMASERATTPATASFFDLAISDDANPNGTWFKYRIDVTSFSGTDIDSPNLAVDANAIYLSADFFAAGTRYLFMTIDKTPLLTGLPLGTVKYEMLTGTQSHGMPVIYGTAPAMYLVETSGSAAVRFHAITNPLTTPVRTTTTLSVPAFTTPASLPSLGTTARITTFGTRFWSCVYRNGSLWACHHQGSTRTLARWYEFKMNGWPTAGTPQLVQSGDIDPGVGIYTSFNSISVDGFGNAMTCFARSSPSEYFSIGRAYRLAADPLGTMRPMEIAQAASSPYTSSRWGDYSAIGVDPTDDATFWYHHEYAISGAWATWIAARSVHEFALRADAMTISQANGGVVNFTLANPAKPNKPYLMLGSASGTSPGFLLPSPPGTVRMPLNYDGLTAGILANLASPAFQGFLGVLDAGGNGTAKLTVPPLPGALGLTFWFAYCQDGVVWDFASNPVAVRVAL